MMTKSSMGWDTSRLLSGAFTYLDRVESTNTWLMEKSTVIPTEIVLTLNQTGGRGRWDRRWVNEPGEGLALSVVVPQPPESNGKSPLNTWIPLLVGVAVVHSVRSIGVAEATLKWPNDVLVGGRKLAGVLCEVRTDGFVVAGVGLNLRFRANRPDPRAVSLHDALDEGEPALDLFVANLLRHLSHLVVSNFQQQRDAVISVLGTIGKPVEVVAWDGSRGAGVVEGLDDAGGLVVRMEDGRITPVTSADVAHVNQ